MSDYGICPVHRYADRVKDPDATVLLSFGWAADLDGDTIVTSTFLLPDGLTAGTESNDDTSANVLLSGGIEGCKYRVTNRITTAAGLTLDKTHRVLVREQ